MNQDTQVLALELLSLEMLNMYENNEFAVNIKVSLDENGIYVFDSEESIGKTRLFKELRKHQTYGEAVATYTYNDKLLGHSIEDVLVPEKHRLIMLDRYTMYEGDGADLINECAKTSIVLIDCKEPLTISTEDKWCTIKMSSSSIEVTK